jgi:hypothetical protein
LYRKLTKRFAAELEHWQMAEAGAVRLVAISTFSVSRAGYATVEQLSLMTTDRNWVPFTGEADRTLLAMAVDAGRSFRKVLAYNGSATTMASVIFTDTTPAVAAFINRPVGDTTDGDASIAGLPVWNWRTAEDMPVLPPVASQVHERVDDTLDVPDDHDFEPPPEEFEPPVHG